MSALSQPARLHAEGRHMPPWVIDQYVDERSVLRPMLDKLKAEMADDAQQRGKARMHRIAELAAQLPKVWRAEWLGSEGWTETLPHSAISLRIESDDKYGDPAVFVRLLGLLQRTDLKRYARGC